MVTKDELIQRYTSFTDEELFDVYKNIDTYSDLAKEALEIVIEEKGGLEKFLAGKKRAEEESAERYWIKRQAIKLYLENPDKIFIKDRLKSDVLNYTEVADIIEEVVSKLEKEKADKAITSRTIMGCFFGVALASLLGGIFWALQLIYFKVTFGIFIIGIALICYGIVRLITKQSKANTAVLIATIISTLMSFVVGEFIYTLIGYQG
ncbi:MAG: hypothetical protein ACTHJT_09450 [Cytophaga sp.]|uniref:hypothetical protein n=1 Tax=Cytophaga sp. TaxID=29535 RepID=UPI003F8147B2